jgi:type IV pilus assembly protein PilE
MPHAHRSRRAAAGFTLIEMMMTVAIAAILASVAIPMYRDYVLRSRIIDATSKLSDYRVRMEQFFMDNRTYANGGACAGDRERRVAGIGRGRNAAGATATAYTATATGQASKGMTGFAYTIVASGAKETTGLPAGWTDTAGCWVTRKDGSC